MAVSLRVLRRVTLLLLVIVPGLTGADWPTYQHGAGRSGATSDTGISVGNASGLVRVWTYHTGAAIAAQPVVVGGTVFVGSWDGFEYALNAQTGSLEWRTYLGRSLGTTGDCGPLGVSDAAAVSGGIVYVGGGKPFVYALRASDGRIVWKLRTGDELDNGRYINWASPLVWDGSLYLGIASHCDVPLVRGAILQVGLAAHHTVLHRFNVVPRGQVGGSVWTSPAMDVHAGVIYVATGNEGQSPSRTQPYARAVVALTPDLKPLQWWQLPDSQVLSPDSDWSGTPTVMSGADGRPLIVTVNKNGYVYAFDRRHISRGPVWRARIAAPDLNVSSTATGDAMLFAAGSAGTWNGIKYPGSVRALNLSTGRVTWFRKTKASVWPALVYANGLVIDAAGPRLEVRDATDGTLLFKYVTGGRIYGPPSVAEGRLFASSSDGNIYAFAPGH